MRRLMVALLLMLAALATAFTAQGTAPFGRLLLAMGSPSTALRLFDAPAWRGLALYRAGRYQEAAAEFRTAGLAFAFNRGGALARAGHYREAFALFQAVLATHPYDEDAATNRALMLRLIRRRGNLAGGGSDEGGAAMSEKDRQAGDGEDQATDISSRGEGMAGGREAGLRGKTAGGSKVARTGEREQASDTDGRGKADGSVADAPGAGKATITDAVIAKALAKKRHRERTGIKSYEARAAAVNHQWLATLADNPGRYLKLRLRAEHARRVKKGTAVPNGAEP